MSAPDEAGKTFVEKLRDVLDTEDVASYSVYLLYGSFDALVRLWGTDSTIFRFAQRLGRLSPDNVKRLSIDHVEYLYGEQAQIPLDQMIHDFKEEIYRVTDRENSRGGWPGDDLPADVEVLEKNGLVFRVPSNLSRGSIKFYTLMERRSSQVSTNLAETEIRDLRDAIGHADDLLAPSIYTLTSDSGYLLKAIATSFDDIRLALAPIYSFCISNGLRPQTYPIPLLDQSYEADLIDAAVRDDSWNTNALLDRLAHHVPRIRTYLGSLPHAEREAIVSSISSQEPHLLREPAIGYIATIFEGIFTNDMQRVNRGRSFIVLIEDQLRRVLPILLESSIGSDWLAWTKSLSSKSEKLPDIDADSDTENLFEMWTWQNLVILIGISSSASQEFRTSTASLIGSETKLLERIQQLRNPYAHGREGRTLTELNDSQWVDVFQLHLAAGGLFGRLEAYLAGSDLDRNDGERQAL